MIIEQYVKYSNYRSVRFKLTALCLFASWVIGMADCSVVLADKGRWVAKETDETAFNVVIVLVSGLRADHLGVYGYSRNASPNIDMLAHDKDSFLFDRAIASSCRTLPGVVSLFISKYSNSQQIDSFNKRIWDNEKTLAQILKDRGCRTAAFTCDRGINSAYGLDKGFDIYDAYKGRHDAGSLADMMPRVNSWLSKNNNKRFFAFLHSYDVYPLAKYRSVPLAVSGTDYIVSRYDDAVKLVDKQIGFLVGRLKQLGIYENTVILVTADHGEELGERGISDLFGNENLYQEVIRIPLIIRFPDSHLAGNHIQSLVSSADIMPTFLEWLGVSSESRGFQGLSFASVIRSNIPVTSERNFVCAEASPQKWAMVCKDGWKLLFSKGMCELYDLNRDPKEQTNVVKEKMSIAVDMLKQFFLWREHCRVGQHVSNRIEFDAEQKESLRQAGYW